MLNFASPFYLPNFSKLFFSDDTTNALKFQNYVPAVLLSVRTTTTTKELFFPLNIFAQKETDVTAYQLPECDHSYFRIDYFICFYKFRIKFSREK